MIRRMPDDTPAPTLASPLEVVWGEGSVRPAAIISCDVLLAADRPDLLELTLHDPAADPGDARGELGEALPSPGAPLRLRVRDAELFAGVVERLTWDALDDGPATVSLHGCAAFEALRERTRAVEFHDVALAELAAATALELGLTPRVDCRHVHVVRTHREGDPLRHLRGLADRNGLDLAVTAGRLHLSERHATSGRRLALDVESRLLGRRVEQSRDATRVVLVVDGLCEVRPLDVVRISGAGARVEGEHRVRRASFGLDSDGWRTRLVLDRLGDGRPRLGGRFS